jgi:Ca2+-binding RTX toxin-like protein
MAIINGTPNDDQDGFALSGTPTNDLYFGFAGDDWLVATAGNDALDGGDGQDVVFYDTGEFVDGVFINNTAVVIDGVATHSVDKGVLGADTLVDIENFHGSNADDTIYVGGFGDTYTFDRAGDDTVVASQDPNINEGHLFLAGSGNDSYTGTVERDRVDYEDDGFDAAGVITRGADVDLATGIAIDGWGNTDTLISIERVTGTRFDDVLRGDDGRNDFRGLQGNDILDGRGGDRDRAEYSDDPNGVVADLASGTATDGWGNTDTLIDIERLQGSFFADILRGDDSDNNLAGKGGDDQLEGRGGDDNFEGGEGNDTINGGVGRDRAEYDGEDGAGAVSVDLALGTATDTFGDTDTLISIEEVSGTDRADTIRGNDADNDLEGEAGDDLLEGRGGNDELVGGAGDDIIDGGAGDGDKVRYDREDGPSAVNVDLGAGTATDSFGDTDTLISIEEVRGTDFDDILRGSDQRNRLRGEDGDDLLEGRANADTDEGDSFDGGAGNDTLIGSDGQNDYAEYDAGGGDLTVDLAAGTATDGFGDADTLTSIEDIGGGAGNDTLLGNAEDNFLNGRAGDDVLQGFAGNDDFVGGAGNDFIDGGSQQVDFSGGDRVRYDGDEEDGGFQGIDADLATGIIIDPFNDTDTVINIEEVEGTNFDDTIRGADASERLRGEGGSDILIGRAGNDDIAGGDGDDVLDGGTGGDFLQPGLGIDTVIGGENGELGEDDELSYIFDSIDNNATFGVTITFTSTGDGTAIDYGGDTDTFAGIERARGTNNADIFVGAEGDQVFTGFGGNDTFNGGAGDRDRIDYEREQQDVGATGGITFDFGAGIATDAYGDTDTFTGIERVRGSNFDDTVTGDTNSNDIQGGDGNDILDSFGGVDNFIDGGRGNDIIFARGDDDFVEGGDGNDTITFFGEGGGVNPGLGSDTIIGGTEGFYSIGYSDVGQAVTIDTALGTTLLAGGDIDTFTNIRNVGGGDGDDTLLGDDGEERQEFFSSRGDDFIDGRGGGRDWLIYDERDETSIVVDFSVGTAIGAFAGTDTFVNIESVRGTSGSDTFIGSDQEFTEYQGLDGVDSYTGGSGQDRINFTFDDNRGGTMGVEVDLAAMTATDGFGNNETFTGIEQVIATDQDDTLLGDALANVLIGLAGEDTLDGRAGNDELYAGFGVDTITGGAGADRIGGRIDELDGDAITDFSLEDRIALFDDDFNVIGADMEVVGDELRIDVDGDGMADATMFLTNGYSGPVNSEGGPASGPRPTVISVIGAGSFSVAITEGNSGISEGVVTLLRSGDVFSTATVDVTLAGSGLNPADTTDVTTPLDVPQTITFAPGQTVATFTVQIAGDADIEADEALSLTLSNPTSHGVLPAGLAGDQTFVRILDDDIPATVNITGGQSQEDSGALAFVVSRTGDASAEITVPYTIRSAEGLLGAEADDLLDGLPQSGSVVIPSGATSVTFEIAIAPDDVPELHDNVIAAIQTDPSWPADLDIGVREATGSIRNNDGVPDEIPLGASASSYGDPHIVTLDGLGYDFQAVGEFTLVEATSGADLMVQARYQPVSGSDIASQTEAIATRLGGVNVMIEAGDPVALTINGTSIDPNEAIGGLTVGGGEIFYDGEAITVVYASGEQLRVDLFDDFLNASVFLAEGREVRGLLGNGDGDISNDLALPDGTVLPQPVSFDDLYGVYADAWRVSNTNSLFAYAPGQGTEDFTDRNFPAGELSLDAVPATLLTIIEEAVADIADPVLREAAIFDALATGDVDTAIASAATAIVPEAAMEVVDAPIIDSAIGVLASETHVIEGQDDVQSVVFTVYRTGNLSEELEIGYSFGGSADGFDLSGANPGQLTLAAGQTAGVVEIGVVGDRLFESNEEVIFNFELLAGDTIVLNSTATVDILDDDVPLPPMPDTVEARYEIVEGRWRDKLVYSVDGEVQSEQRLRFVQEAIEVKDAGLSIFAEDGLKAGYEFITTVGQGVGVWSLFGDPFWRPDARRVDEDELLTFALDCSGGLGDATEVQFEFAIVRGGDEVLLTFFDDGEMIDETVATIVDDKVSYALDDGETFDALTIQAVDRTKFAVEAIDLTRLHCDEFEFLFV